MEFVCRNCAQPEGWCQCRPRRAYEDIPKASTPQAGGAASGPTISQPQTPDGYVLVPRKTLEGWATRAAVANWHSIFGEISDALEFSASPQPQAVAGEDVVRAHSIAISARLSGISKMLRERDTIGAQHDLTELMNELLLNRSFSTRSPSQPEQGE